MDAEEAVSDSRAVDACQRRYGRFVISPDAEETSGGEYPDRAAVVFADEFNPGPGLIAVPAFKPVNAAFGG